MRAICFGALFIILVSCGRDNPGEHRADSSEPTSARRAVNFADDVCVPSITTDIVGLSGSNVVDWLQASPADYVHLAVGTQSGLKPDKSCLCLHTRTDNQPLACGVISKLGLSESTSRVRIAFVNNCSLSRADRDKLILFKIKNGLAWDDYSPKAVSVLSKLLYVKSKCYSAPPTPPSNVKNLRVLTAGKSSIKIGWDLMGKDFSYKVKYSWDQRAIRSCDGGFAVTGRSEFEASNLIRFLPYYFRVCTVRSGMTSPGVVIRATTR